MCDQTEVSYLEDDVVWVKIGPIWWPGVVKDLEKDEEGREILAGLKKKPIAVVKFFQEENYEFVKNLEHIYHYSCRRKDEFIKKGLDKFRTGASHMKKFPADVTTAESLTNGDVNIINDPKFLPEKKESYSEIFGSGKKKTKKESETTTKIKGRTSSNVTPYRPITHQRFINKVLHGESDHKVKTLIQCNTSSDDSASGNPYKCHICKFETSRVNVIVAHHRLAHSSKNSINWTGSDSRIIRKKPVHKPRKIKSKKSDTSREEDSDEEIVEKKKPSPKSKTVKEKTKTPEKRDGSSTSPSKRKTKEDATEAVEVKKPRFTDVLLADWNEDEEEEKKDEEEEEKKESPTRSNVEESEPKIENTTSEPVENTDSPNKNQNEKMSCFDFDEEEEGFIGMSNANTYGRKIPRVIPVKDKPELGMDLEIEELFKKKNDEQSEPSEKDVGEEERVDETQTSETKEKPAAGPGRRRRSKASKDDEPKPNAEDSLALRRTRRPGAKKSYLNEVIEKIDDDGNTNSTEKTEPAAKVETKVTETSSSSRRKQDFKQHTMDGDREEIVYSDIVNSEQKPEKKRGRGARRSTNEDLTAQIDNLLEETKLPSLPGNQEVSDESKPSNTTSFSFDYTPGESGKKTVKPRAEVKSISRMFSDSIPGSEGNEANVDSQGGAETEEASEETEAPPKTIHVGNLKFSQSTTPQKRGSIVLSSLPKSTEGQVKVVPVVRQANTPKDCIVLPSGKKLDVKKQVGETTEGSSDGETSLPKNIKAIKVKSDSLPSSLITAGKLKGQTIIHQKGGKYVIVTQPPQAGRPRTTPGKVQTGSKVVILTNQLRDPKIITGGLQQKYKVEGQKVVGADAFPDKDVVASGSSSSGVVGQTQPIIKMVPDGKGGIMKQLTVSPKKVLLGGTKVLVSASGSTFSTGNSVQKIALSGTGGVARATGGDYRLIENYKGSGKTVLIQGGTNSGSGVVLKPSSAVPRQVTKVIQSPQTIPALKKKPKILMRASTGPGEYVMQSTSGSIESPTFVVKQKTSDGKFATQKIVRTEIVNQPKPASPGTKTFFLSGQGSGKKGESYIITTNDSVPGKVIRMRHKIKEVDGTSKPAQKSDVYSISPNSLLIPSQTVQGSEATQIVQIQEQPQQQQSVLQTQVIAMPGPVGADGNQTYVLVSVDENGVVQGMDNSVVAYDATAQQDSIFVNPASTNNVILINPQTNEETTPVFSTSSQDILAEALANTNVLDGSINNEMDSVVPSILLPPSIPSSVVQETSITLQKPIMTPLEMPSSVTPDTSGLEPPPLPPTPTEEDVLMEDSEMASDANQEEDKKDVENSSSTETVRTYLESENFAGAQSTFQVTEENPLESAPKTAEVEGKTEFYQPTAQEEFKETREEFPVENQQEEQTTNSFQSLPVLNDEPDTSDDAQGAEPASEPHFEPEKSEQFSQVREQEPPSSTNNEMLTENVTGFENSNYHQSNESESKENEQKTKEGSEEVAEEQTPGEGGPKEKEQVTGNRESQSLPVISDENNANAYEMDPIYPDVISQKRFQEETEVSSTTDEFANKDVTD